MFKLDENKYRNAILYFASKIGSGVVRGKKKMYKLFYYLDFDSFEEFEKPITGDIYHKLPMGPAPSYFDVTALELQKEGLLSISKDGTGSGYNDTIVYKALAKPDMSVFSSDEIKTLDRVIRLYGSRTGTQLESLTHKEAPYLAVEDDEEIPLELAHYRGSDFK